MSSHSPWRKQSVCWDQQQLQESQKRSKQCFQPWCRTPMKMPNLRLVGGAETWNGWSHTSCVVKNQERDLSYEGPRRNEAPQRSPQPRTPMPEREVTTTFGCKNQRRLRLSETDDGWSHRHSS